MFGDESKSKEVKKEKKERISRWGKKKRAPTPIVEDTNVILEVKENGFFDCLPTKEMAGVEPAVARLCATVSHQLYKKASFKEFKLSHKDIKTKMFIYEDHAVSNLGGMSPPFLAAITGDTMILGWRGTCGLMDGLNDAAFSPQASLAWRKHSKTIKAQGAMTSIVMNDIALHEDSLIAKCKELGIKEIVTTGQSLGGGLCQIAHLTLRAQIQDEASPWSALEGVNVRSVAFCGPMSTVLLKETSPETEKFIDEVNNNSCNFVYKNDPVPRAYGYLSFIEDLLDDAQPEIVDRVPVRPMFKRIFDLEQKLETAIDSVTESEALKGIIDGANQYVHLGNIIYYKDEDATPIVLQDYGAFYQNTNGKKDLFRSVKYEPVKTPLADLMGWHMDIINGPGLAYPPGE